jgi:hypothetical protein
MITKFQVFWQNLIPFLILGFIVALGISIFIMFSYVLIWGFIIGAVFWAVAWIKRFFFPKSEIMNSEGRIIEQDKKK